MYKFVIAFFAAIVATAAFGQIPLMDSPPHHPDPLPQTGQPANLTQTPPAPLQSGAAQATEPDLLGGNTPTAIQVIYRDRLVPVARPARTINRTYYRLIPSRDHKQIYQAIKSWNPASASYVDAKVGQLAATYVAKTNSSVTAGQLPTNRPTPPVATTRINAATTAEGETMVNTSLSLGWLFFWGAVIAFVAWLLTYLVRGPMPMWLRTKPKDFADGIKGWIREQSAHGDNREISPGANWEATKLTDLIAEPKAIVREQSAHGDKREIVPNEVAIAQANAEAQIAHSKANQAIAEATARQNQDNALAALVAGQTINPILLAATGGGYIAQVPSGGSGSSGAPSKPAYTADELKELGVIKSTEQRKPEPAAPQTPKAKTEPAKA